MSDKVAPLGAVSRINLPTDRVLDAAKEHCSDGVVIMGYDDDSQLYFASSIADGADVLWLIEKLKILLLEAGDD